MILKVFTQPSCPACPPAKELAEKLEKKMDKILKVEYSDVSKPKGLAEATTYDVMSTPTLVLLDLDNNIKKVWVGTPEEQEVLDEIGK